MYWLYNITSIANGVAGSNSLSHAFLVTLLYFLKVPGFCKLYAAFPVDGHWDQLEATVSNINCSQWAFVWSGSEWMDFIYPNHICLFLTETNNGMGQNSAPSERIIYSSE